MFGLTTWVVVGTCAVGGVLLYNANARIAETELNAANYADELRHSKARIAEAKLETDKAKVEAKKAKLEAAKYADEIRQVIGDRLATFCERDRDDATGMFEVLLSKYPTGKNDITQEPLDTVP